MLEQMSPIAVQAVAALLGFHHNLPQDHMVGLRNRLSNLPPLLEKEGGHTIGDYMSAYIKCLVVEFEVY
jgi:hypothetical protein